MHSIEPPQSDTPERLQVLSLLEQFLQELQLQPMSYKVDLQRRLNNQFHDLFRRKTFDECLTIIQKRGLERTLKYTLSENYLHMNQFTRAFLQANLDFLKKRGSLDKDGIALNDVKGIIAFLEEEQARHWNDKKTVGREMWNERKDDILLDIMRKKYPELLNTEINPSKLRIKWKEVCHEFKKQCKIHKENDEILGKHCRERWINHLDPNMKKGNWTLEEDLQLLKNALSFKRRWCLISNEVRNRSQHSLKNRFFHLMSTNLNITNKACLKRKNFNDDIMRIIEKYRQMLRKEGGASTPEVESLHHADLSTSEEKPVKVEESCSKEKETTMKVEMENMRTLTSNQKDMENTQRFAEMTQRNLWNNGLNTNVGMFWPGFMPNPSYPQFGMFDPRFLMQQYYQSRFLNKF